MHCDLLAFELLYFILVVNVIGVIAGGILKHILVARLYDGAGKSLNSRLLRGLRLSVGIFGCRLVRWRLLPGLLCLLLHRLHWWLRDFVFRLCRNQG
jgi:hypothetical protein